MEMPRPTAGHAGLERLAGLWMGEETMHPSQWDPKGGSATAQLDYRMALGGFALVTDYEQQRDGHVTYQGHGVMTFDPATTSYKLHWFDSMGSPPEVFSGSFDGDVLVLAHGGPGMHARMTYDLSSSGILKMHMDMSRDGTQWHTLFDGVYRRR